LVFVQNDVKIAFMHFNSGLYIHPDYLAVEDLVEGPDGLTLAWARSLSGVHGDLPDIMVLSNIEAAFLTQEYGDTSDMLPEELFGLLSAINLNYYRKEDIIH